MTFAGIGKSRLVIKLLLWEIVMDVDFSNSKSCLKFHETHTQSIESREYMVGKIFLLSWPIYILVKNRTSGWHW